MALFGAMAFIVGYFSFMVMWIVHLYEPETWEDENLFVLFTELTIGFYMFSNLMAVPVNYVIVYKEFSMEFFQFLKRNAGSKSDNVSLGIVDLWYNTKAILDFFNPVKPVRFLTQPY